MSASSLPVLGTDKALIRRDIESQHVGVIVRFLFQRGRDT